MKVSQLALAAATVGRACLHGIGPRPGRSNVSPGRRPGGYPAYPAYQPGMGPQAQFSAMPPGANYAAMTGQGMPQMSSYPGMQSGPAYAGGPMPAGNGVDVAGRSQPGAVRPSGAARADRCRWGAADRCPGASLVRRRACGPNPVAML